MNPIQCFGLTFEEGGKYDAQDGEHLVDRRVTYSVEIDGKFVIVENVPARVDEQTGETSFRS